MNEQVARPTKEYLPAQVTPEALEKIEVTETGLRCKTLADFYALAACIHQSGLAPQPLRSVHSIMVCLQFGHELGMGLLSSLQNIAVINGRPSLWGDAMLALCMRHPDWDREVFHEWFEGDGEVLTAFCRVGRKGRKEPIQRSFSVKDAKAAGLWGRTGPWTQYPRRMLQMRARSWALRDAFPDLLQGIYTAEEAADIPTPQSSVEQPTSRVEALRRVLSGQTAEAENAITVEPLPAGGHEAVEEAAAKEVAAGPNGTTPEIGKAKTIEETPPPKTKRKASQTLLSEEDIPF